VMSNLATEFCDSGCEIHGEFKMQKSKCKQELLHFAS
jgi:hypothetical protein